LLVYIEISLNGESATCINGTMPQKLLTQRGIASHIRNALKAPYKRFITLHLLRHYWFY